MHHVWCKCSITQTVLPTTYLNVSPLPEASLPTSQAMKSSPMLRNCHLVHVDIFISFICNLIFSFHTISNLASYHATVFHGCSCFHLLSPLLPLTLVSPSIFTLMSAASPCGHAVSLPCQQNQKWLGNSAMGSHILLISLSLQVHNALCCSGINQGPV